MSPDLEGNNDSSEDDSDPEAESEGKKAKAGGFTLEYDGARKIAQSLGADLGEPWPLSGSSWGASAAAAGI